jgi:hypothetical protein
MSQTYGIEASHAGKGNDAHQPAARYMVLIDSASGGTRVARLFLDTLQEVAEFDATAPEVLSAIDGLVPAHDGLQPRWELALAGHSERERAGADIYTFDF